MDVCQGFTREFIRKAVRKKAGFFTPSDGVISVGQWMRFAGG